MLSFLQAAKKLSLALPPSLLAFASPTLSPALLLWLQHMCVIWGVPMLGCLPSRYASSELFAVVAAGCEACAAISLLSSPVPVTLHWPKWKRGLCGFPVWIPKLLVLPTQSEGIPEDFFLQCCQGGFQLSLSISRVMLIPGGSRTIRVCWQPCRLPASKPHGEHAFLSFTQPHCHYF